MDIRKLNSTHIKQLELFLRTQQDTNLLILSNLATSGVTYEDKPYHGEYYGSFTSTGELDGVLVHYWNGSLMMHASNQNILSNLLRFFTAHSTRPIKQILGTDEQAIYTIKKLALSDTDFSSNTQENLYRIYLDHFKPSSINQIDNHDYSLSQAGLIDHSTLSSWIRAYEIEALKATDNDILTEHVQKRVQLLKSQKHSYVLTMKNTPLSLCGCSSALNDCIQIGPVWTPPEQRNKGYARALLNRVLTTVKTLGVKKALLFSDNPKAIKLYTSVGFEHFGYYRLAILKEPYFLAQILANN